MFYYLVLLDPWVKWNLLPVCFGARDNQFGSFNVTYRGKIAAVKLIHLSGYVMCQSGYHSYWSFWGCGKNPAVKKSRKCSHNNIKQWPHFPTESVLHLSWRSWKLGRVTRI